MFRTGLLHDFCGTRKFIIVFFDTASGEKWLFRNKENLQHTLKPRERGTCIIQELPNAVLGLLSMGQEVTQRGSISSHLM
jgi:hypothetical protein